MGTGCALHNGALARYRWGCGDGLVAADSVLDHPHPFLSAHAKASRC
jgi:hypothetical protein